MSFNSIKYNKIKFYFSVNMENQKIDKSEIREPNYANLWYTSNGSLYTKNFYSNQHKSFNNKFKYDLTLLNQIFLKLNVNQLKH